MPHREAQGGGDLLVRLARHEASRNLPLARRDAEYVASRRPGCVAEDAMLNVTQYDAGICCLAIPRWKEAADVRSTGFSRNAGEEPPKGGTTNGTFAAADGNPSRRTHLQD